MSFLTKSFLWIVLAAAAGYGAYFYLNSKGPCQSPIEYKLGTFDTQFNISQGVFLDDIAQAANIWNKAYGKTLFAFDPKSTAGGPTNGDLPINLIYDSRQAAIDQDKGLETSVDQAMQSADSIKQQFQSLQTNYNQSKQQYSDIESQFEQSQNSYNSEVQLSNSQGGASQDEYTKLTQEKNDLLALENTVEQKRIALNDLADQINALIGKYNYLATDANSTISTINKTAGEEFEEGEYVSDSSGDRINIYEFEDTQTLVRVLAHELGHSIGLAHNSNPDSIMYYLNNSKNMVPTADDMAALDAVCHGK